MELVQTVKNNERIFPVVINNNGIDTRKAAEMVQNMVKDRGIRGNKSVNDELDLIMILFQ